VAAVAAFEGEEAMTQWSSADARAIATPEEIQLATRRQNGTLRKPRTIWIVSEGDWVFIRSTNGRTADWFRAATATGAGQLIADGTAYEVVFRETENAELPRVDAAYRAKYGRYASIVDHLVQAVPRAATLDVHPA
jgi:hypothetical protein